MVRLKVLGCPLSETFQSGFNSKMVRLKVAADWRNSHGEDMFQFQNGAIKRLGIRLGLYPIAVFQFQNGAIKRANQKWWY